MIIVTNTDFAHNVWCNLLLPMLLVILCFYMLMSATQVMAKGLECQQVFITLLRNRCLHLKCEYASLWFWILRIFSHIVQNHTPVHNYRLEFPFVLWWRLVLVTFPDVHSFPQTEDVNGGPFCQQEVSVLMNLNSCRVSCESLRLADGMGPFWPNFHSLVYITAQYQLKIHHFHSHLGFQFENWKGLQTQ